MSLHSPSRSTRCCSASAPWTSTAASASTNPPVLVCRTSSSRRLSSIWPASAASAPSCRSASSQPGSKEQKTHGRLHQERSPHVGQGTLERHDRGDPSLVLPGLLTDQRERDP